MEEASACLKDIGEQISYNIRIEAIFQTSSRILWHHLLWTEPAETSAPLSSTCSLKNPVAFLRAETFIAGFDQLQALGLTQSHITILGITIVLESALAISLCDCKQIASSFWYTTDFLEYEGDLTGPSRILSELLWCSKNLRTTIRFNSQESYYENVWKYRAGGERSPTRDCET